MGALILALFRWVVRLFYRVEPLGAKVPEGGPLLLLANHPGGLADPALVLCATPRPIRMLGKAPLFSMPLLGAALRAIGSVPVYRAQDGHDTAQNQSAFEAVHRALCAGEAIALFPEGKSHNQPSLAELKTGAARMALGADSPVQIVPVGITYGNKTRFRSRVSLWVGDALDVTGWREQWEREHPDGDERARVQGLTAEIRERLRSVTLQLEHWDELPLLAVAERLWSAPEDGPGAGPGKRDPEGRARMERIAALAKGWRELKERDPAQAALVRSEFEAFEADLRRLGAKPGHLDVRYPPMGVARFALAHGLRSAAGVLFALAARAWFLVPWLVQEAVLRSARPGRDVVATYKVLSALLLFPLWHALLSALLLSHLDWPLALWISAAAAVVALVAARLWHEPARTWREVRLWLRRSNLAQTGDLRPLAHLRRRRAHLSQLLAQLAAKSQASRSANRPFSG